MIMFIGLFLMCIGTGGAVVKLTGGDVTATLEGLAMMTSGCFIVAGDNYMKHRETLKAIREAMGKER